MDIARKGNGPLNSGTPYIKPNNAKSAKTKTQIANSCAATCFVCSRDFDNNIAIPKNKKQIAVLAANLPSLFSTSFEKNNLSICQFVLNKRHASLMIAIDTKKRIAIIVILFLIKLKGLCKTKNEKQKRRKHTPVIGFIDAEILNGLSRISICNSQPVQTENEISSTI
jgi:hypothetical protein